ncbi:family 1 glycosylhydrolase [Streptomyces shenzhenensis]|uniref:family 1 glycosylhydrolase n=1 Tax=Streptomyces shenzhenensis TaxID=943815 RepID=UPI0015F0D103|nr:family 1 glycosylhydrolase [Streptomyces shenzhenensis]
MHQLPADFLRGVASDGYQNEGDNVTSDCCFAGNVTPTIFREKSGKPRNGWERWREDVDLAVAMHLNSRRFSVEWARIEPVEGEFSHEALAHYEAIVDYCLSRGLAPVVTFEHFVAPHWSTRDGGRLSERAPERFARYRGRVMSAFGDRIAAAITMNEPDLPPVPAWAGLPDSVHDLERATLEACSRTAGAERYRLTDITVAEEADAFFAGQAAGHRATRAAIKARRPDLPTGLSIAVVDDQVHGTDATLRDLKRDQVYRPWLEMARDDDSVGIQNYERHYYDAEGAVNADGTPAKGGVMNRTDPASPGSCARYAHAVSGVPVMVTDHGLQTDDDTLRAAFIEPSLQGLQEAMNDGIPVLGHFHRTLPDSFEWIFGFGPRPGLHSVDPVTFDRTPKPSAGVYGALVAGLRHG